MTKRMHSKNDKVYIPTFDKEAVLTAPSNLSSIMYYKRKLSEYNLNIFSLGDKETTCFVWNKTEGQRGFNKVGTCLYKHTLSLPHTIEHVILYSDTAVLHYAAQTMPYTKTINQKSL